MIFARSASLILTVLAAASAVSASPLDKRSDVMTVTPTVQVQLTSAQDFCMFFPPSPGMLVAPNEDNGIPFCSKAGRTKGAKAFPKGTITTAHYLKTSKYAQVTGYFDRTKYKLQMTDGGGQYDNHNKGKPVGATCKGYKYFVQMLEPDIERFCIRCCHSKVDCNTGRSEYGCLRVVPGDYQRTNTLDDVTPKAASKSSSKTSSASKKKKTSSTSRHSNVGFDDVVVSSQSAFDAFHEGTNALEEEVNARVDLDVIKSDWNAFLTDLALRYPASADDLYRLETIANGFTTYEDWEELIKVLRQNLNDDTPSATAAAHNNQATW
ncbi:hypothetical protein BX666DRAFT_1944126 [Dichotomocladium elegans]|nr:hypothetical protein BX666DRAFT_1944126 [Dichotomocladium elegans]